MRISLINLSFPESLGPADEHLGLGYIAALLRTFGHDVLIIDNALQRLKPEAVAAQLIGFQPRLIGVSVPYQDWAQIVLKFVADLRNVLPQVHICLGGHFPSFEFSLLLQRCAAIDSIVVGEGEITFCELARALENGYPWQGLKGLAFRDQSGRPISAPRQPVEDLDELPFPARDHAALSLERNGRLTMVTSRGCYGRCTFCSVEAFYRAMSGPPWRGRSAKNIVSEMAYLQQTFAVHDIRFWDDQFLGTGKLGRDRIWALYHELKQQRLDVTFSIDCRVNDIQKELFAALKEVGLRRVYIGIESGSQQMLDSYNKYTTVEQNTAAVQILTALGIQIEFGFIMFAPDTSLEDLRQNIRFIRSCGLNVRQAIASTLVPYSGTPALEQLRCKSRVWEKDFQYYYRFSDPRVYQIQKIILGCIEYAAQYIPSSVNFMTLGQLLNKSRSLSKDEDDALQALELIYYEQKLNEAYLQLLENLIDLFDQSDDPLWSTVEAVVARHQSEVQNLLGGVHSLVPIFEKAGLLSAEPARPRPDHILDY